MHVRTELASDPRSAAAARRFAHRAVGGWGLADADGRVALLVSELVTNAVLHASGSPIELVVSYDGALLRIEVHDRAAAARPRRRRLAAEADRGRGLVLVDSLASAWGVEETPSGKSVWFSLALPQAAPGSETD